MTGESEHEFLEENRNRKYEINYSFIIIFERIDILKWDFKI